MKAIYSLLIGKNATRNNEYCGYRCKEELLDSLLLSSRIAFHHFKKVEIYCDSESAQIIQEDGRYFPLDIIICLNHLTWVHEDNWAYSKVYVYAMQKEPFVHIDIDAFLWDGFSKELIQKKFIFQQVERIGSHHFGFYHHAYKEAKELNILPRAIKYQPDFALNCAVFACTDIRFFNLLKEYFDIVKEYVSNNNNLFDKIRNPYFQCVLFEQLFIVNILDKYALKIGQDYDTILNEDRSEKYFNCRFTHLLVYAKRDETNVQNIKWSLSNLHRQLA